MNTQRTDVPARYRFGDVEIDFQHERVTLLGNLVQLSRKEFKLLEMLIRYRGQIVTRGQILTEVWGYDVNTRTRTVDVHVSRLRRRLEKHPDRPQYILTVHAQGYVFAA